MFSAFVNEGKTFSMLLIKLMRILLLRLSSLLFVESSEYSKPQSLQYFSASLCVVFKSGLIKGFRQYGIVVFLRLPLKNDIISHSSLSFLLCPVTIKLSPPLFISFSKMDKRSSRAAASMPILSCFAFESISPLLVLFISKATFNFLAFSLFKIISLSSSSFDLRA